ncbi:MAG: FAD-dependent oxidoreductase [Holophaga sp.]|nr:FAD-dependent oxidoreductase [Holophaga sp.]
MSTSLTNLPETQPARPGPPETIKADVCIVGMGAAALTTAYLLVKEGASVVVLGHPGASPECPVRSTAALSHGIDHRLTGCHRLHGAEMARLLLLSQRTGIDLLASLCAETDIRCRFERLDGFLFGAPGAPGEYLAWHRALAERAGAQDVQLLEAARMGGSGPCLRFPGQGQFRMQPFLKGLGLAIERLGGRLLPEAQVCGIDPGPPVRIHTQGLGVVSAAAVLAARTPLDDLLEIQARLGTYHTHGIGAVVPRGAVARAHFADSLGTHARLEGPLNRHQDLLVVEGEAHKLGRGHAPAVHQERLEAWARARFPVLGVRFRWTDLVMEAPGGAPLIGPNPWGRSSILIAPSGMSAGMACQVGAGAILRDLLLGRPNPLAALHDPLRVPAGGALAFAPEARDLPWNYAEWLEPGSLLGQGGLAPGSGAVLRRGLESQAVYRDHLGEVHELSAFCPTLGAPVRWNPGGRGWSCPCHGSGGVFF